MVGASGLDRQSAARRSCVVPRDSGKGSGVVARRSASILSAVFSHADSGAVRAAGASIEFLSVAAMPLGCAKGTVPEVVVFVGPLGYDIYVAPVARPATLGK